MANKQTQRQAAETLADKALERKERVQERINAETPFNADPEKNIQVLAQKAYPRNKAEQERYADKIKASLEKHVKGSIDELWKFLKEQHCENTAIIEGILHFFAGKRGENEIALERFLKPTFLPAESNLDKVYVAERKTTIEKTKNELADLLDEIRASNPGV